MYALIRLGPLAALALALTACSTYYRTVGVIGKAADAVGTSFEAKREPVPEIDLTNAKWQKLDQAQPDANPLRAAVVARDEKVGATRVVLKAPANFALPPFWLAAQGTYTVLKGTFVFEGVDADGRPTHIAQGPGSFALVPANLIQRAATKGDEEALLYITVYGDWSPRFAQGAWKTPALRAGS
jgi:hypothetical protein